MTPVRAIVAKELRSAFVSPIVYVVGAVFLLIFGILSYLAVINAGAQAIRMMQLQGGAAQLNLNDLVFRPTFYSTAIILLLVLPILTMRVFAEERKLRTFELLMTSPVGINEIVVGKFLAIYAIFLGLLALTGIVPLILSFYSSFDWNPVMTGARYNSTGMRSSTRSPVTTKIRDVPATVRTAAAGTSTPRCGDACSIFAVANEPGLRVPSSLGTTASTMSVREAAWRAGDR